MRNHFRHYWFFYLGPFALPLLFWVVWGILLKMGLDILKDYGEEQKPSEPKR